MAGRAPAFDPLRKDPCCGASHGRASTSSSPSQAIHGCTTLRRRSGRRSIKWTPGFNLRWPNCSPNPARTGRFSRNSFLPDGSGGRWSTTPGLPPCALRTGSRISGRPIGTSAASPPSRHAIRCSTEPCIGAPLLRRCLRRLRREVWLASRGPPGLTGEENNGRRVASSRTLLGPARPGKVQEDPSHRVDQPDKTAWNPLPGRSPPAKFNTEQDIPEMRPSTDPGARRSLTSPGMSGWLEAFLACRGVERPDGRALYAYRCTDEEFGSLAEALSRNPPRGGSARPSAPATRTGTTSRAVPSIAELPALGAARWIRSGRA